MTEKDLTIQALRKELENEREFARQLFAQLRAIAKDTMACEYCTKYTGTRCEECEPKMKFEDDIC